MSDAPAGANVAQLSAKFFIKHPRPADLVVEIVAPNGQVERFWDRQAVTSEVALVDGIVISPSPSELRGAPVNGKWTLRIQDVVREQAGIISNFNLTLSFLQRLPPVPAPNQNAAAPVPPPITTPVKFEAPMDRNSSTSSLVPKVPDGLVTLMSEGFEGFFPTSPWALTGSPSTLT